MLSRGLPTFPSLFIEETLTNQFKFSEKKIHDKTGEIYFKKKNKLSKEEMELLYNSLFVVDPRITDLSKVEQNYDSWEEHAGSEFEEKFYKESLPRLFHSCICQLTETQRSIKSIIEFPSTLEARLNKSLGAMMHDFYGQRVDLSIQFPDTDSSKSGLVIEIDGAQHSEEKQARLDEKRDDVIEKNDKWLRTVRINTDEVTGIPPQKIELINELLKHPFYQKVKSNFENPIWKTNSGLMTLQLALTPFGIARIQKTIIYLISQGILDLTGKVWKFAFIERDVPCAEIAIKDLQDLFENLFELEGNNRKLPKIEYKIFTTKEFNKCQLNNNIETDSYPNPRKTYKADFLFDISVLQRSGLTRLNNSFKGKVSGGYNITIRSSYSQKEPRVVRSAKSIVYKIEETEQPKSLVYFLQNLFRKKEFREGQVNILRRSLKQENVIALLPTGLGKSLTYQLSVLLQPGIVLVVDPLKSLMKDQNDNLNMIGIDSTVFINSSIKSPIERDDKSEKMVKGYYQFIFISPERLQIREFRDYLKKMDETCFTYCVVDEAHCVSEWGHDFRTSYLRLGQNARKYCNTFSNDIPILGLTGTASYDVLADVQRELEINDESAIVKPSKYARDELNFEIIDVGVPEIPQGANDKKIKDLVAGQKQEYIHQYLDELPDKDWETKNTYESIGHFLSLDLDYINSGLIFCPHVTGNFGVTNVSAEIGIQYEELNKTMGIYAGSLSDDDSVDLEKIQNQYKNNELNLLVATKAFGMGIDKPNIRFTIHYNMPQSIESFYQEAGRAGRDKDKSFCGILFSQTTTTQLVNDQSKEVTVDKNLMLSFFYNSFRGIEKEKRIMWELLNSITFPYRSGLDDLRELTADIDYPFKLNLKINKTGRQVLYVNGDIFGTNYGSIYLDRRGLYPEEQENKKIISHEQSMALLESISKIIDDNCPKGKKIYDWLSDQEKNKPAPGLEKLLNTMNQGASKKVGIGYSNDRVRKILDYLNESNNAWDEAMILKANNYCFTPNDFIKNLSYQFWRITKNSIDFSSEESATISKWFYQIRDESDTYKAVYRLSVVGVIDDYEVDYKAKEITVTITKKKDEDHVDFLQKYIRKYVSKEEADRLPDELYKVKGDTVIQKCCSRLAKFVYDKIASKRLMAINQMEDAIQFSLAGENFEEIINTYFDSRFTSDLREFLYEFSVENVWEFLLITEGEPDSINHLRGACDRLLVENPDNPLLLILRGFSRLLILNYNKSDAIGDLRKGWKIFTDLKTWTRMEYLSNFSKFYGITSEYSVVAAEYLDQELVDDHINWLKGFNKTFLKGIANA